LHVNIRHINPRNSCLALFLNGKLNDITVLKAIRNWFFIELYVWDGIRAYIREANEPSIEYKNPWDWG
jgi:hypothetical protein